MNISDKVITLIFPDQMNLGKQAVAHATNENKAILHIDPVKTPITGTDILKIADLLGVDVDKLLNKEHALFQNEYKDANFKSRDWIHIIQHNPEMLKMPIAIKGKKAVFVNSPADVSHL